MFELMWMTVYVCVCVCMCMCAYLCPYMYVCVACVRECLNMCACVYLCVYISIYTNKTKYRIVIFMYTVHILLHLFVILYSVIDITMRLYEWWLATYCPAAGKILQCCHTSEGYNLSFKILRYPLSNIPCQVIWRHLARSTF